MNKKLKIAYFVVMAITGTLCVVDIVAGKYVWATLNGINLAWLIISYFMARNLCQADADIEFLLKELREAFVREKLHHQTLAEMRERAQNAEIKLQQMIDDTPARGADGQYVKREIE